MKYIIVGGALYKASLYFSTDQDLHASKELDKGGDIVSLCQKEWVCHFAHYKASPGKGNSCEIPTFLVASCKGSSCEIPVFLPPRAKETPANFQHFWPPCVKGAPA